MKAFCATEIPMSSAKFVSFTLYGEEEKGEKDPDFNWDSTLWTLVSTILTFMADQQVFYQFLAH